VVATSAANWPSFRGPSAAGVSASATVPAAWNVPRGERVKWRTALPGNSHASPIVWENRVYAISARAASGEDRLDTSQQSAQGVTFAEPVRQVWTLYAVDLATGRMLWERRAHEGTPIHARHVRGTYANATPATNGRHIVATLGNEGLFCFDMNGTLRWRREMPPPKPDASLDPAASPIIFENLAIVQVDMAGQGYIAAYELESGREAWRVVRQEHMTWSTPVVVTHDGRPELVANSSRWVRGYNPRTGAELWRLDNRAEGAWDRVATPFFADGLIVVAGGGGTRPIYAVRPGQQGDITPSGATRTNGAIAWVTERGSPYLPTPVAYQGLLYVLADNGVLTVYDMKDGAQVYVHRVASGVSFQSSPVAAAGRVYVASGDGDVYVIKAGRAFELLHQNPVGEPIFATPAIADGRLILRTISGLLAIG
jgi:outer membrane protein assembly factor BamB